MSTSETEPSETDSPASSPAPQLSLLLELQDDDLALDRLAYRRRELPERAAVSELTASRAELSARIKETDDQRDKLASQLTALDQRSEAVGARVATIEERLRSGRAGSYRDEQAMGEEAASLARQHHELEDQQLELMEALEPLEEELSALRASASSLGEELSLAKEQLAIAEVAIDDEAEKVRAGREELAGRVAPELAASYERLRAKLGGIGAAHVVGGACSGCHLQLPAGELHRLRHSAPDSVVYCDQCGRILVS
ncbi:MAG: C4-type zinc ribbon domain-containing protein [Acidimicrobiales bacterium]|jgi:predicted  nucleic acid-binding Zn-ribbon protein